MHVHIHTHTHTVPQLQIWDTAGMEQFRNALVTKYYRNADGIVLVFDITKRESFEGLDDWISEVKQYCEHGIEKIKMVLIGNKVDRLHQRKVRRERERDEKRERKGVGRESAGYSGGKLEVLIGLSTKMPCPVGGSRTLWRRNF